MQGQDLMPRMGSLFSCPESIYLTQVSIFINACSDSLIRVNFGISNSITKKRI